MRDWCHFVQTSCNSDCKAKAVQPMTDRGLVQATYLMSVPQQIVHPDHLQRIALVSVLIAPVFDGCI